MSGKEVENEGVNRGGWGGGGQFKPLSLVLEKKMTLFSGLLENAALTWP